MYVTQKGPREKQEGISWKEKQRKGQRFERGEINWHWEGRKMKSSWRDEPIRPGPEQGDLPARTGPGSLLGQAGSKGCGVPIRICIMEPSAFGDTICCRAQLWSFCLFSSRKGSLCIKGKHFFHKSCKEPQHIWCTNASCCLLQIVVHHTSIIKGSEAKNFLKFKLLKNK